jgi:hypothetical protein
MNRELYERAVYPSVNAANSRMLLSTLTEVGREQALAALTNALVAPQARELAEMPLPNPWRRHRRPLPSRWRP